MSTVHLLSAGAARGLVNALAPAFERSGGHTLRAQFGAVGTMRERLDAGEPCDAIILSRPMIDALARERRVEPASIVDLGRVRTGVAVPRGAPHRRVDDEASLRDAVLHASAIYLPDPQRATAGIHCLKVLRGLGVADEVAGRLHAFPNGATAMAEMARAADAAAIGITQVTEILYTDGVELAGVLPRAFELATLYSGAVVAGAAQAPAAAELLRQLAADEAEALRRRGGFEPV